MTDTYTAFLVKAFPFEKKEAFAVEVSIKDATPIASASFDRPRQCQPKANR